MNRTFLYAVIAFAFAGAITAQQPAPAPVSPSDTTQPIAREAHRHRHNAHHEAAMLARRLNLTPDQTEKVEPILADRDQKLSTLHGDASLAPDARRTQMRAIRLDTQQQLGNILTPEQRQKVQSMHHHGAGRSGQAPPPTPSGL